MISRQKTLHACERCKRPKAAWQRNKSGEALWPWVVLTLTRSFNKIHQYVYELKPKINIKTNINAYMTLTFGLVTLTLGQLQHPININNICKYHQDPSIRLWFIGKNHLMGASVVSGQKPRDNAINLVKRLDPKLLLTLARSFNKIHQYVHEL